MHVSHLSHALLVACLVLVPAAAQTQTIVSPTGAAAVEGSGGNLAPWVNTLARRYLQIHSDVGGTPKLITKLAFRKDGTSATGTGTRLVDCELFLGNSVAWNQARFVISDNYVGPRTSVMARKTLTFGPLVGTGTPSPFEVALPLDAPFVFLGVTSLAWEAVVYSNTANGTFASSMDIDSGTMTTTTATSAGTGCVVGTNTLPMLMALAVGDVSGTFALGGYLDRGPASAPAVLYLGATNPNQSVPGLCGPLYTDLRIGIAIGSTDATGFIGAKNAGNSIAGGSFSLVLPNTFSGALIHAQVHAIDVGSTSPIPVANSNGASFTVPAPNATKIVRVTRVYNFDGGPTALAAQFFNSSSLGYGLVTQFSY